MFSFDPAFHAPLVPDSWPVFDEVLMFSPFSSSASSPSGQSDPFPPAPPSADLASMPIPPSRPSPRNKNPDHIPRPRNAFMLFRSAFAAAQKVSSTIEHDNRHITRIIAHCWNRLPEADKQIWRDKAAAEKAQHAERHPNYRFSPVGRAKKPKKRKVHRNGENEVRRCLTVAEMVMSGKCGSELEHAMRQVDRERDAANVFTSDEKCTTLFVLDPPQGVPEIDSVPPFLSPLLPPAKTVPQQVLDKNVGPHLPVTTTTFQVEPQTLSAGTDASTPHGDLKPLFYQYYQHNDAPCLSSVPPVHSQSVIAFMQNNYAEPEQATPGFSIFSWNQSDSFKYYH